MGHYTTKDCNLPKLLKKKAIRIITNSNYIAHTEPLLKISNLLKLEDIIMKVKILKSNYQHKNNNVPLFFSKFLLVPINIFASLQHQKHEYKKL